MHAGLQAQPQGFSNINYEFDKYDEQPLVTIIGAGYAGLGLGILLKRSGYKNFRILERQEDVGGCWQANTYPGIACDIPSHLYSFSFIKNPNWSKMWSPGDEIQRYLRKCAEDEGLLDYITFGVELDECHWDEAQNKWLVKTNQEEFATDYFINAAGALVEPDIPDIPGIDTFKGKIMHTAKWDNSVDLSGKRVACIGTGASAVQMAPQVAKIAKELIVFMRTASHVMPRENFPYSEAHKRMFAKDPQSMEKHRMDIFWMCENRYGARRNIEGLVHEQAEIARKHLEAQVKDPKLREQLTPKFKPGCKRLLFTSDFFPIFERDNVTLEPSALKSVTENTVISADGNEFEVDVIAFATGFEVADSPIRHHLYDRNGKSMQQNINEGVRGLRGLTMPNFPNFFNLAGLNIGSGHNSQVIYIETLIAETLGALKYCLENKVKTLEPTTKAEHHYNQDLDQEAEGTIFLDGGCSSWYLDENGKLTALWPSYTHEFQFANGYFRPEEYGLSNSKKAA
ncbi:flavin-containing monooxygenase [Brackiella oedipodis]|uniref:flavin-containing monooxygenase n=1 Tax=Brackiella oedipodis TaxID=124225 RepID=UPI000687CEF5|nr:NAD(P)/FAD-dependent oxidoreductase [Brackiella oedipodis]